MAPQEIALLKLAAQLERAGAVSTSRVDPAARRKFSAPGAFGALDRRAKAELGRRGSVHGRNRMRRSCFAATAFAVSMLVPAGVAGATQKIDGIAGEPANLD